MMVFDSIPFEPDTLFSAAKNRVSKKITDAAKIIYRKKI